MKEPAKIDFFINLLKADKIQFEEVDGFCREIELDAQNLMKAFWQLKQNYKNKEDGETQVADPQQLFQSQEIFHPRQLQQSQHESTL